MASVHCEKNIRGKKKKEAVILGALGSQGRLIWLKMKREGQRQRRVEWGSQGRCLGKGRRMEKI